MQSESKTGHDTQVRIIFIVFESHCITLILNLAIKSLAVEEVQVASYAALAIMRRFNRFEPKLEKLIRWIAEQENSQGGFNSVFVSNSHYISVCSFFVGCWS